MVDRQNRVGSKFGGGGVSSAQQSERERKERLRELALETIDLAKDPYLMRNHLGTYECKLCLTLHTNEANYLSHTQGKKHQSGLARRAAMEAKLARQRGETDVMMPTRSTAGGGTSHMTKVKIGRPGYEVSKSRDPETNERCLTFELHYPELDDARNRQPRHRFMSAYEQRVETPPDGNYQYLLVACDPYETVGFKIPNEKIDRGEGKFVTNWDIQAKVFTLTLHFLDGQSTKKV
jgi:splicing factor 3A subunit 2